MDACPDAVIRILVNEGGERRVFEVFVELFRVQAKFACDGLHSGVAQVLLAREQLLMHFPELTLFSRGQGCHGRLLCITVHREGKLFDDEFHILRKGLRHLPEQGLEARAVRSLVIVEDNNGNRRLLRPPERRAGHIDSVAPLEENNLEQFFGTA